MKKLIKGFLILFLVIFSIVILLALTSPWWAKSLVSYILEKNFGKYAKAEDVKYIFPNKVEISTLEVANFATFSNVSISLQNPLKLSPINIELTKPKMIIIHNEKGEWTFPQIPGIDTSKSNNANNISIEIKAKIKDGIVVVRDLKIEKDIEVQKVNGNLYWKNQMITYSVSTSINNQEIKSYGTYDFSKEEGNLTFEFKNALADVWAGVFLPNIFYIEKGYFTGWINTKRDKNDWVVSGEINAFNVEGRIASLTPKFVNVSTKVKIDGENINILDGRGNLWDADIKFLGKATPKPEMNISFESLNLEKIDKEFFKGSINLRGKAKGEFSISESWENAIIKGYIIAEKGSIYNFDFNNIKIDIDSKLPLVNAKILGDLDLGNLNGKISFDLKSTLINLNLEANNVKIEKIAEIFNLPKMEGKGDVTIEAKKDKKWKISVSGIIENGKLGDYSAESIEFNFENEDIDFNLPFGDSFFFQKG